MYVLGGWLALTVLVVLTLRWADPPGSAIILHDRIAAWIDGDRRFIYQRAWVDLQRVAPSMQLSVIASEDQRFPEHWGFDFGQIGDALESGEHGRMRGASTISQQVAKNLFLWRGHSWVRKGIEAYFTVLIEAFWPKRRILEIYLNSAEFGHGIYGVQAAARTYFHKSAGQLTAYDAALLAAVLPNPNRLRVAAPSFYVRSRQRWILGQMNRLGPAYLLALR